MPLTVYDPLLTLNCDFCPNECPDDGCTALFAVGNCSTIINDINPVTGAATANGYVEPVDMIFDTNTWHTFKKLKSATYNSNLATSQELYVGACLPEVEVGARSPTIDITYNYCRGDEGHCLLQNEGCLVAWMLMDNGREFLANISAQEKTGLRYGVGVVVPGPITKASSTVGNEHTATIMISRYMWSFNLCEAPVLAESLRLNYNPKQKTKVEAPKNAC